MDPLAFLGRLRARLRRVVALAGVARLASLAVLLVAGAVVLDWQVHLPGWLRACLLAGVVAALVLMAWRRLVRPLRRPLPAGELAAFCERRIPALDGRLLTAVAGIDLGDRDRAALAAALPPGVAAGLVPARHLGRDLALAAVALAAAAVLALAAPGWSADGLRRLLLPFGTADWARSGALAAAVERAVAAEDERVVVRIERLRGPPAPVVLSWGAESRQLRGLSGPWSQSLSLPRGRHVIEARSGDAQPVAVEVLVVARPQLRAAAVRLEPPAYSGLPPVAAGTLAGTVLPGTRVVAVLDFAPADGRPLAAVRVRLGDAPLPVEAAGASATVAFAAMAEGVVSVQAEDADGIALHPVPRFALRLGEDRAPVAALDGIQRGEVVAPSARVALRVRAQDDLGLAGLVLVTGRIGGTAPASAERTALADPAGAREAVRSHVIDLADARPGDQVTVQAEAADRNDVTGPGIGRSEVMTLRVVGPEELRQDLERQIAEAQDKVGRARDQVGLGLARDDRLAAQARAAALDAARAADLAATVLRRVATNRLAKPEEWAGLSEAIAALAEAQRRLVPAAAGDAPAAREADQRLAAAERALAALLQEGDLARTLAALIQRQRTLGEETVAAVRAVVLGQDGAQDRLGGAAERQRDLAEAVREWERRLDAQAAPTLAAARSLAAQAAPAARLGLAARRLAGGERERAPEDQAAALADLERLLALLRGAAAQQDLAGRIGELAMRQERLAQAVADGRSPAAAAAEQQALREELEALAQRLEGGPKAQADAAGGAQQSAAEALQRGDRSAGGAQAAAAAALLRRLQRALDGQDDRPDDGPKNADILRLIETLRDEQLALLVAAQPIHGALGEEEPGFAAGRAIQDLADRQDGVRLRLQAEVRSAAADHPIVVVALDRVGAAMGWSHQHLARPALGHRGMDLLAVVVAELERLLAVARSSVLPEHGADGQGGGGGQGGGQAPAIPAAAELSLLAAMAEGAQDAVAAGRAVDLAALTAQVRDLVELLERGTRPGSRPAVLLQRAGRAARSAVSRLQAGDRGAVILLELQVVENSLRRILAEADGGGGGGESSSAGRPRGPEGDRGRPQGDPPGSQGAPGGAGGREGGQSPAQGGQGGQGAGEAAGTAEVDRGDDARLLGLPPEVREKLRQARDQQLTPAVLEVYQRYLELLLEQP